MAASPLLQASELFSARSGKDELLLEKSKLTVDFLSQQINGAGGSVYGSEQQKKGLV